MRIYSRRTGLICVCFFLLWRGWLSAASAQRGSSLIPFLTTSDGLPHNAVTGVAQDRTGFIWIATHDGLARYDGRTVKPFRNRPGDSTSLADNKILELQHIDDGTMLVNTGSGTVQRFDPTTERFTTLLDARSLAQKNTLVAQVQLSADGRYLWGLLPNVRFMAFDLHQKTSTVYNTPLVSGNANRLQDFMLTPTGYIYGIVGRKLLQFNTRTGRSRFISLPFPIATRWQTMAFWPINGHQVVMAPNGQIAIFGYDILAFYDPVRDQFRTIPIPNPVKVEARRTRMLATVISYSLKTMADNHLYVGYLNRIYRLDDHDQLRLLHPPGILPNKMAPWWLDRSGILWASGASAGLNRLDVNALPFGFSPQRKSFSEDLLEQDLGVSLPDSFQVWDIDHWPRYVARMDKTGYLIDPSRIYRYTPTNHRLTELTGLRSTKGREGCKLCLKLSRSGVAGAGSVWFYDNERGLVEAIADRSAGRLYPNSQIPLLGRSPGYDVSDIQPIGRSVWVGSQSGLGLYRYDIDQKRYDAPLPHNPQQVNALSGTNINCLSADPVDSTVLWIGTVGGGLCRLDTRTMIVQRLGEAEGFPDRNVKSIETDAQGMLWCATNRGLVRLNRPVRGATFRPFQPLTWRHFTTDDGLADNVFLQTSSACLPDGRLVFGTLKGRVIFDPKAIRDKGYEPPIVLTSLLVNNKPVEANLLVINSTDWEDRRATLPAPLNTLSELVLDYTQNFLTIAFAGLDYGKSQSLKYRYQLTGVDDNWVTTGTQNTANYTQLAPGHYVFYVNSTTADGRWSHQIKQLAIVITPPFWATWWAYLAYALASGGLVLGFIRFRTGQIRQQQEIRLKRQEAEQLRAADEVKARFFSNITHEFRTPLTLILSPTEKLLKEPKHDAPTRQTLHTLHTNAGRLLRLINQLLDLSKLEGKSMTVALSQGDAVGFVAQLAELFRPTAASRDIALQIETNAPVGGSWLFDADKWEKIVINLLSNAFKFTPSGGQVSLRIEAVRWASAATEQLRLTVADTGIGIQGKHIAHIFDRFYQVDGSQTRAYEGTGIGLALVKELTELLGGTITVQSWASIGTTFTATLPLQPAIDPADARTRNGRDAPIRPTVFPPIRLSSASPDGVMGPSPTAIETPLAPIPSAAEAAPLVLVVDDNEELRTFIANELAHPYRVLTAANGEEAWAICRQELPDVVVTDVMMPRMDGYQLIQAIKSSVATNHIAVVLLTAKAAHESRITGLAQGADDYLTKPFHLNELSLRLQNLLTHQQNVRANLHRQLLAPSESPVEPILDSFVHQLQQAIESRLDDATFGVDDLAQAVAMSRRTLYRKLTTTTNLTANEFIRHYRLRRATQLLKTGRSVTETAYLVGFENAGYFTKVFKQVYQQTPSEFVSS